MSFPEGFTWGAAAASYQIEGSRNGNGNGKSVWDNFCQWPGKVFEGQDGFIACDHYNRYAEDAALMGKLGLSAYRLSISWPRVFPNGTGAINEDGIDFYDRLVDSLLENNVVPWVTLFHWDYPLALYDRGGWLNSDSPDWFADYTAAVVKRLSDRVSHWFTLNEPQCTVRLGHQEGSHAPGLKLGPRDVLLVNHHHLLAHGKAVQAIRAHSQQPAKVGAAPVGVIKVPASDKPEDIEAARKATFASDVENFWCNAFYTDPMVLGKYPEDLYEKMGHFVPATADEDMKTICQPLDFYGANIYLGDAVEATEDGGWRQAVFPAGQPRSGMDFPSVPESLYWGPRFLYERYKLPIVISENGLANLDWVSLDGKVHDPQRIDFTQRYLREFGRAIDEGVVGMGYFYWSIMDNFEWSLGYSRRFGLIHVDYQTQKRTPKDSAYWYSEVIKTNGANL